MRQSWVRSLGREDPLEKEMATHSSTHAWKIPWTKEPSKLQSMGSQRVWHNWATSVHFSLTIAHLFLTGFSGGSVVKNPPANAKVTGSIPGSGRFPGEGNGNPLQYFFLENPKDGGTLWTTVHGVAKSRTQLSELTFTFHFLVHICNGIYVYSLIYSALKRDKIGSFVEMWMDLETVIQREGKSERENQHAPTSYKISLNGERA